MYNVFLRLIYRKKKRKEKKMLLKFLYRTSFYAVLVHCVSFTKWGTFPIYFPTKGGYLIIVSRDFLTKQHKTISQTETHTELAYLLKTNGNSNVI